MCLAPYMYTKCLSHFLEMERWANLPAEVMMTFSEPLFIYPPLSNGSMATAVPTHPEF